MKDFMYVFIFIALQSTDAFCSYGSSRVFKRREAMRQKMAERNPALHAEFEEKRLMEMQRNRDLFMAVYRSASFGVLPGKKKFEERVINFSSADALSIEVALKMFSDAKSQKR